MSRKYKISILLFMLMVALGVVLEHKLYEIGEISLKKNAEDIFQSAVDKEFDEQYQKLKLPFQYRFSKSKSDIKNCIITNANEKNVIDLSNDKDKTTISASYHKKMEHTILANENSIFIDSLSLMWNEKLQEAGIVSKNAIRICLKLPKDTTRLLCGDSNLCSPKYKIKSTFFTGLSNEIEIEAFIHYSWTTVLKHSSSGFIIISLFTLCSLIFLSLILFFWKKAQKVEPLIDVSDSQDLNTLVWGNLSYKLNRFYVNDKEIKVRAQTTSLLLFLLKRPELYATKHEIIMHLWKDENIGVDTRLRRAISDLRIMLKKESVNIEMASVGDGYRLIVQN